PWSWSWGTSGRLGWRESGEMVEAIVPGFERPEPPSDMPHDERIVWRSVVDAMPSHWFKAQTHDLLRLYCGYACAARIALWEVRRLQAARSKEGLNQQIKIADKLAGRAASLASKLRIAPQPSKHTHSSEAQIRKAPSSKPWLD